MRFGSSRSLSMDKNDIKNLMVVIEMVHLLIVGQSLQFIFLSLTDWLDMIFIISLLVLLIGCILLVIQGGFFDRFIASYKYFLRKSNKVEEIVSHVSEKSSDQMDLVTQTNKSQIHLLTKVLIVSGGILVLFIIFLSYSL